MRLNKYILVCILFCLFTSELNAQNFSDSLRTQNQNVKLPLSYILGKWHYQTSPDSFITFEQALNTVVTINGIKHGVGNYIFNIQNDSVMVNGYAPNWPPYDCTLKYVNDTTLECLFYQYHYPKPNAIIFIKN